MGTGAPTRAKNGWYQAGGNLIPVCQDIRHEKRPGTPFLIYTDGASRGNPGPAAAAFVIIRDEVLILQDSRFLGTMTNNAAEYEAVIMALTAASTLTDRGVTVISDSELVIRQLNGFYRVRQPHLMDLHNRVSMLCTRFVNAGFCHVTRDDPWIRYCDALCNHTLDAEGR